MAMPRKLKNMNLFNDGHSYLGAAKAVTLPKLTRKMEAWRGAGMNGPVEADLGFGDDGIQLEWTLGGLDLVVLRQFGHASATGVQLRFAGAYQQDDTGEVTAVEVIVRGRHKEIDKGEATPGEDTEHKITTTCAYYKLVVNGATEIEIDLLGGVENVGGEDRMAEQRKAIGV